MPRLELSDFPELEGYVSVAKAAQLMNVSKPSVYYMIYDQGLFAGVRRIGGDPADPGGLKERAYLLIPEDEFERVRAERETKKPPLHKLVHAWNERVRAWGKANDFHTTEWSRPTTALVEAYLKAHPDDPRPARPVGPSQGPGIRRALTR